MQLLVMSWDVISLQPGSVTRIYQQLQAPEIRRAAMQLQWRLSAANRARLSKSVHAVVQSPSEPAGQVAGFMNSSNTSTSIMNPVFPV